MAEDPLSINSINYIYKEYPSWCIHLTTKCELQFLVFIWKSKLSLNILHGVFCWVFIEHILSKTVQSQHSIIFNKISRKFVIQEVYEGNSKNFLILFKHSCNQLDISYE